MVTIITFWWFDGQAQARNAVQQRLKSLFERSGETQTGFATAIGIDRSALKQLFSGRTARLPRVETLLYIAERHTVSLDWLLGIRRMKG
jgi:transcriptional regulator with XRE-family HTH domain